MGRTDWDRILSVDPSSLTDDDMEDLYPAMISCDVDEISDVHNLRILMKLSQEILQYKDNQVTTIIPHYPPYGLLLLTEYSYCHLYDYYLIKESKL